jgi:hypothetical protein
MSDPRKKTRFRPVTVGVIVHGLIVACLSLCVLSLGGRIIAPELHDSYPPPSAELETRRVLLGAAIVASALVIGLLAVLRRLKSGEQVNHPLCRKCGYSLTGNVSGVCPECGAEARSGQLSGVGHRSDGKGDD